MQGRRTMLSHARNSKTLLIFQRIKSFSRCLHLGSYCQIDDSAQVYSYNRAIDGHLKSGRLSAALQLFDEMPVRDSVSWNLLISGYKRHGLPKQAIEFYGDMVSQGVRESPSTLSSVLSVCGNSGFYVEGIQVHCRVILLGFSLNLYVGSAVVDLYMQLGVPDCGLKVFDEMPERNCAVWNLVLRGFCKMGLWGEVLRLFQSMKLDFVEPNDVTFCYLMSGCCNGGFVFEGKQVHAHAVKAGLDKSNLFVANAFVDFYSVCGSFLDARVSFDAIAEEDVLSWNSMVYAYSKSADLSGALACFSRMQHLAKKPSIRSFVGLLNLCSVSENLLLGRQIHSFVSKLGFNHGSVHIQSALIDMYGKCFEIKSSVDIFDSLDEKTIESCNALLTSLLHCNQIEDVIELFGLMVDEGVGFDEVSLSCTLKALSLPSFVNLTHCTLLHCCATKSGYSSDNAVSCALIDSYSKLGKFELSRKIFDSLSSPNLFCFTAIINGYACNGLGTECLELFKLMLKRGLKPDQVTLFCVLTGCNHSGLLDEARVVFGSMKKLHGYDPDRRHYGCMIDLLGRAGLLSEAEEMLEQSLIRDDPVVWSSLLRSCRVHRDEEVGRRVARCLVELARSDPASCMQASSFYFEIGDFESSTHCRELAMAAQVCREVGCSLIESRQLHHHS